jgi:hypothetical protein
MDEQFGHPRAEALLREVRQLFETKAIFQRQDRPIVFLCGGPVTSGAKNMRREFLTWAKRRLPELVIILAENAFKHTKIYHPLAVVNLSEFEALIASVADCVLLFPESAGSFAELGLFSGNTKLKKKMLVANRIELQAKESFVNLGPIRTIDKWADLRPTIQLSTRRGRFDFEPLKERLHRLTVRPYRKSFQYVTYENLEYLGKVLVILEMISIFNFVTIESLYQCMRAVFDTAKPPELKRVLSILTGAAYVRFENGFYFLDARKDSLLEFEGFRMDDMRARVIHYYKEHRKILYLQFKRALSANR